MIPTMEQSSPADEQLLRQLAEESRQIQASSDDLERNCWMVVHRHVHGFLPSEYDIREVPEDLYTAVVALRRSAA